MTGNEEQAIESRGVKIAKEILSEGVKDDGDKLRMDLLDSDAIAGLAAVLTFGAKKYAAHNWRNGINYSRLLAALLRHTFEVLKGNDIDKESGLPHIDHIGCCWMFLSGSMKQPRKYSGFDDRYKIIKEVPDAPLS